MKSIWAKANEWKQLLLHTHYLAMPMAISRGFDFLDLLDRITKPAERHGTFGWDHQKGKVKLECD